MSFESVSRWSGMAALLSGLLWIWMLVETASRPAHPERGPFYPLIFLTIGLLAVGLFGIHLRQRDHAGRLGTISLGLTSGGLALLALGRLLVDYLHLPPLPFAAGLLMSAVGLVVFEVSIVRAGVLPRAAAWLLLVGTLALVVFNFQRARELTL